MFRKILIANRGEIAVRIIRTCREMGIQTVAAYSEADRESLAVRLADESICVGPAAIAQSYLNIPNIISAAEISSADAIHPGYGFLSENPAFAEICDSCGLTFIGPRQEVIKRMGNKVEAKRVVEKEGVRTIPWSGGALPEEESEVARIAAKIGYPVILKAAGGGGGKGMRIVLDKDALKNAISTARAEAKAAFGSTELYLEKFFENPRHVEVQIVADQDGHVVALPERDCSIQRRYQKLVEESPSPSVGSKLRKKMFKAAVKIAKSVHYSTVGTIEFLLNGKGEFAFMEMNTRLQVEHPVTELVTGLDLVREQIRLAAGERLGYDQDDVEIQGHSIECRINAEDPDKDFIPSPGTITRFHPPGGPGVRVDTHACSGYEIPTAYDNLIAKVITIHHSRPECINRMARALSEFLVEGVKTTIPFHQKVMRSPDFQRGDVDTGFIRKHL